MIVRIPLRSSSPSSHNPSLCVSHSQGTSRNVKLKLIKPTPPQLFFFLSRKKENRRSCVLNLFSSSSPIINDGLTQKLLLFYNQKKKHFFRWKKGEDDPVINRGVNSLRRLHTHTILVNILWWPEKERKEIGDAFCLCVCVCEDAQAMSTLLDNPFKTLSTHTRRWTI